MKMENNGENKSINVHFIIEGDEEEIFFEIIKEKYLHTNIRLTYINACGAGNIPAYYQNALASEQHDCVLCVFDVDYKQKDINSPFSLTQKKLERILGNMNKVKKVCFCTNPNILLLFLLGFDKVKNVSYVKSSKKKNTELVHKYWPKIGNNKVNEKGCKVSSSYCASAWQLLIIKNSFIYDDSRFIALMENAKELPTDYMSEKPGSNLLSLLTALVSGNIDYFIKINTVIMKQSKKGE